MPIDTRRQLQNQGKIDHYVYCIRRPIWSHDTRYYIGVSSYKKYESDNRWAQHLRSAKSNKKHTYLYGWLKKHNDCYFEIIYGPCSMKEAYDYEEELVPESSLLRKNLGLVNEMKGGLTPPKFSFYSEEKQKEISDNIRKAWNMPGVKDKVSGDNHWTHKISKEQQFLYGKTGKDHPCFGLKYSQERLDSISGINHHNFGKKGELCKTSKPVIATNIKTGESKRFVSAKESCNLENGWGKSHGNVINCCKGKAMTHNGCIWRYERAY